MKQFLEQLFASGQVSVPPAGVPFDEAEMDEEIREFDRAARLALAGEAPALDLQVARWAALLLAEAARLVLARDVGPEEMARVFARPCPRPRSPETDYSADLFLRYVPELMEWVRRLAADDPLIEHLRRLGGDWPLSSVGMQEVKLGSIAPFIGHASLRQLYADRILAMGDVSRLGDARISEAVRAALGAHGELAPTVATALSGE